MKKYLTIIGITLLTLSCQKQESSPVSSEGVKVQFVVYDQSDMEESDSEEQTTGNDKSAQTSTIAHKKAENKAQITLQADKEFDSYILQEEFASINQAASLARSKAESAIGKEKLAVAPEYPNNYVPAGFANGRVLTPGVKFRILVYDTDDNFVEEINGTAGSSAVQATNLNQGKTYHWFAYSYYTSAPLPALSSYDNPQFNVENEDFIYASGTFTTPVNASETTNTEVAVRFKHAMSMIEYSVILSSFNGKADYATFLGNATSRPYIKVAPNVLKKGVFNLKSQSFSTKQFINTDVYVNARANYAFPTQFPTSSYHGFFYTVPDGDNDYINNFNSSIQTWTILDWPTPVKVFNKNYTHKVRSGRGKFSRISIIAIDNGISIPGSSSEGPTNWSRGDLYYDTSQGFAGLDGTTRFQHRSHDANSNFYASSFQVYGIASPTASYGQYTANYGYTYYTKPNIGGSQYPIPVNNNFPYTSGSPCANLQPTGENLNDLWRIPTVAQGIALAQYIKNNQTRISHTYNTTTKSLVMTINNSSASFPDPWSQRLSFEMKGYAKYIPSTNSYTLTKNPSVTTSAQSGSTYIWLNGGNTDGSSTVTAYLELSVNSSSNPKYTATVYRSDATPNDGVSKKIPGDFNQNDAIMQRCVRNYRNF